MNDQSDHEEIEIQEVSAFAINADGDPPPTQPPLNLA